MRATPTFSLFNRVTPSLSLLVQLEQEVPPCKSPPHPGKSATIETSGTDMGGLTLIKWSLCTHKSDTFVIENNIKVEYFGVSVWENVHWLVQTQQDLDMTECRPCPPTHPPIHLWDGSTFCPLIISSRFTAHPSSTHQTLRSLLWYNLYILSEVVFIIQILTMHFWTWICHEEQTGTIKWFCPRPNLLFSLRTQVASKVQHKLVFFFPWLTQINLAF